MKYLKDKLNRGNVTIVQLVTWGISLGIFAASAAYGAYASTQKDVVDLKVEQATMKQQIANIDNNTNLLVKELIKKQPYDASK
jgi:hypothetical protein